MARCLIIGCGCRGEALIGELRADGHAVRATTRRSARLAELEATGAEAYLGDPDRVATLTAAFDHVSAACILLGSATGGDREVAALHGPRLEMLLARMLDTTIRGIVYEGTGSVEPGILARGAEIVRRACSDSLIPHVILDADPGNHSTWARSAAAAVAAVLAAGS